MNIKTVLKRSLSFINKILSHLDRFFLVTTGQKKPLPPLFIVGVPRSGTTLTYQIITQQFQVSYFTVIMGYFYGMPNLITRLMRFLLGRPTPTFESQYGKIKGFLSPSEHANYWFQWFPENNEQGHYVNPKEIHLADYESLKQSIESITTIMQKPMVFKCLYLDMAVGALAQIFPEARFLFVRRDRLMVCQSLLLGRLKQKHPEQWWSVKPPHYQTLLSQPLWQQITEQVFSIEKTIFKDLKQYAPNRYLELQYEDLCQNPEAVLNHITQWLEPIGYQPYQNQQIPKTLTLSKKIILSETTASYILKNLERLEQAESIE